MRYGLARRTIAAASVCALAWTAGAAAAEDEMHGIDPNQGRSLVEVEVPNKAAAVRLQLEAERYGVEFNDHYLRQNRSGTVTVSVFGGDRDLDRLEDAGYDITATIEGPATWRSRAAARQADVAAEKRADEVALAKAGAVDEAARDDVIVLRADYFENYAGRFLSVEAKDGTRGSSTTGESLSLSWNKGAGTPIDSTPRTMSVNIDTDTNPDTYIEHRELVRIGDAGSTSPARPTRIRIGSSNGAAVEADVDTWLGGGLPPMADGYLKDFTTRYMDPTEVYKRVNELAAEFPNIAELVKLPHKTNGYQRRAQATMAGTSLPGVTPPGTANQLGAVVLTSRAWGHEGGNEISAEFVNPGIPNAPLTVTTTGKDIKVSLATNAASQLSSTALQVVEAINANGPAKALVKASTFRFNPGSGIVAPRAKVNLSDFLTTATNAHVKRGPFEYSAMRIGKQRDGSKVGVYLYCQQHAREWATPLTCLETAEQLVRNYAIDPHIRELVDNLDIFILPSANPDGAHFSMHNFAMQRRNLTNHCVVGGKSGDDPHAENFWTPGTDPITKQPYVFNDPAARQVWGVDLNRNNTFGTIFGGYVGASSSCISDIFAGPAAGSEPEMRNENWIADTFKNIKFSNNIHSFGGYFMWAPGSYLADRSEGEAVHANIGVEKYFFAAGDKILNRIKETRNTAILPERTGPIADVLYSAAGSSADAHYYQRGTFAYSFETGADRFGDTTLSVASAAGAKAIRAANRNGFRVGDRIKVEAGTANEEIRTVTAVAQPNTTNPDPNVTLDAPLDKAHAAGVVLGGGIFQSAVGFQPPYASEGKFEALEFAAGNIGLLESALEYANDTTPPEVRMTGVRNSREPITTTFEFVNEPSVIHYTTDNSQPTESSPKWDSTGPREPGQKFVVTGSAHIRWMAKDMKGNVSYGHERFVIPGQPAWSGGPAK